MISLGYKLGQKMQKFVFYPCLMGHFLLNHPVMQALGGIPFSNDNYRRPVAPLVFYGQQNKGSKAQWLMRKNLRGSLMSLFQ